MICFIVRLSVFRSEFLSISVSKGMCSYFVFKSLSRFFRLPVCLTDCVHAIGLCFVLLFVVALLFCL